MNSNQLKLSAYFAFTIFIIGIHGLWVVAFNQSETGQDEAVQIFNTLTLGLGNLLRAYPMSTGFGLAGISLLLAIFGAAMSRRSKNFQILLIITAVLNGFASFLYFFGAL